MALRMVKGISKAGKAFLVSVVGQESFDVPPLSSPGGYVARLVVNGLINRALVTWTLDHKLTLTYTGRQIAEKLAAAEAV